MRPTYDDPGALVGATGAGDGIAERQAVSDSTTPRRAPAPGALAPRGAIPNWRPATTFEDYLRNCREGLEEYSDRRAAQLLRWSRMRLHRARLMAELPDALFEQLLAHGVLSSKALANIAIAHKTGNIIDEIEHCPHCGGVLRARLRVGKAAQAAIGAWLESIGAP